MKRYKIKSKIGAGGMGEVYKAWDNVEERFVAIKILPSQLSHNEEVKKRFLREMTTCAAIDHPNVIHVHDFGQMKDTLYYVMEYIDGKSVAELIDCDGALPVDFALTVTEQVLSALACIHSKKLVHRDLKPSNVLIERKPDEQPRAVLMDFGLVKAFDSQLTRTGRVLGTPRYIAPEMLSQGKVDHRSDIFQLGIVLYEMLVGDYAFKGATRAEVARNCLTKTPEAPSLLNPGVDVNLDNLIFNAIEKSPDSRYSCAEEMAEDLRALREGKKIYRRNARRRIRDVSAAMPVVEAVDAASVMDYLDDGSTGRRSSPTWLLLLLPLLIVPLLLVGTGSERKNFLVKELHVDEGVDRVVITWRSDEKYRSIVQFGTNRRSMSIVDSGAAPTTRHKVQLAPLREGTSYVFQVVFPGGGHSGDYTFETKTFELSGLSWAYGDGGKLDITWKTNVPSRARLVFASGRGPRVEEDEFSVLHRQLVEPPSLVSDVVFSIVSTTRDGNERSSKPFKVPSLLSLAWKLDRELQSAGIDKLGAEILHSRNPDGLFTERLEKAPFRRLLRGFVPAAALFFESERIGLDDKISLYHHARPLLAVDAAMCARECASRTGVKALLRGDFALLEGGSSLADPTVETVQLELPEMTGLSYDPRQADSISFRSRGLRQQVEAPLLLLKSGRVAKAELRLTLVGLSHELAVFVTINGRLGLAFYNTSSAGDSRLYFSQRFPAAVLRDGSNSFELALSSFDGKPRATVVRVESFAVALQERRP